MPIYEYLCEECHTRYERLVLSREETIACPQCGSPRHEVQLSSFSTPRSGSASPDPAADSGARCTGTPDRCGCRFED